LQHFHRFISQTFQNEATVLS